MKNKIINTLYDLLSLILGSFLFAAAINMFIIPGDVVLGGATGIATVATRFTRLPAGVIIALLNLPLLIINARLYGIGFVARTAIGVSAVSVMTDTLTFLPVTVSDPLLCAIFGGIAIGAGTGLLFVRGYTTGGTDLIAWAVKKRSRKVSTGRIIMLCDLLIILALTLLSRNMISILYSAISLCTSAALTDWIIDGALSAKTVFIISDRYEKIADTITNDLSRGVTVLDGKGYYTQNKKNILLCVIKQSEIFVLKRIIESIDRSAFVFFFDATEVQGDGFEQK